MSWATAMGTRRALFASTSSSSAADVLLCGGGGRAGGGTRCQLLSYLSRGMPPAPKARLPSASTTERSLSAPDVFGYRRFTRPGGGNSGWQPFASNWRVALGCGAACVAAYVYTLEPVSVTHRYRNLLLSERAERALGARVFEGVKREALANRTLLRSSDPRSQRVRRVGKRVAAAVERLRQKLAKTGEAHRHLRALNWEFIVINSDEVNAFVVPGGKVCVFSGLLRRCRSDDELATVIGHEAGHVVARHTNENVTTGAFFTAIRLMLALALDVSFLGSAAVSVLFELPMRFALLSRALSPLLSCIQHVLYVRRCL